ncbi:MAG: hypothetical protein GY756_09885 [bacterium]|nr:hypothetical protein [bacterium]
MITFNAEKHEYRNGGKVYPSVTHILQSVGLIDFSNIPPQVLELAMTRGIAVHKALELWDNQNLNMETLSEDIMPYVSAWTKFLGLYKPKMLKIEEFVFSMKYQYAGTPDRVAIIDGKLTILDIKSTFTAGGTLGLQTAGYTHAFEEMSKKKIIQRMGVLLNNKGDFRIEICKNRSDTREFLGYLHQYRKENNHAKD